GRKNSKIMNGTTIDYYFDGDDLIIEAQGSSILAYYTQGQGLSSQRRNNATYFYHYDGLGSTKALTDGNQNIQGTTIYDAWGNVLQSSGTISNPYLYVGELGYYVDSDAGMYLLTQRWYNPVIGRFLNKDPLRAGELHRTAQANLYIYVLNNPLKLTDPLGEKATINCPQEKKSDISIAIEVICKLLPKRANCIVKCATGMSPINFSPIDAGFELLRCLQGCCKWGKVICNVNHPGCWQQTSAGPPCGFSNCHPTKPGGAAVEKCVAHLCPSQFYNPGCFPLYGTIVHEWTHSCGYCLGELIPKSIEDCMFGVYGGFPEKY
ncbi:MAG: RHS repeat domain-containing protein, partial [bacterium]